MVERVKEIINTKLEKGETLLSIGYFKKGLPLAAMLITTWAAFTFKYYYMGVTNRRLFIIPAGGFGPVEKKSISVPLSNVEMEGKNLFVKQLKDDKTQKFVRYGIPELIGVDIREFEKAIETSKGNNSKK
jgi:hypothetical protein